MGSPPWIRHNRPIPGLQRACRSVPDSGYLDFWDASRTHSGFTRVLVHVWFKCLSGTTATSHLIAFAIGALLHESFARPASACRCKSGSYWGRGAAGTCSTVLSRMLPFCQHVFMSRSAFVPESGCQGSSALSVACRSAHQDPASPGRV